MHWQQDEDKRKTKRRHDEAHQHRAVLVQPAKLTRQHVPPKHLRLSGRRDNASQTSSISESESMANLCPSFHVRGMLAFWRNLNERIDLCSDYIFILARWITESLAATAADRRDASALALMPFVSEGGFGRGVFRISADPIHLVQRNRHGDTQGCARLPYQQVLPSQKQQTKNKHTQMNNNPLARIASLIFKFLPERNVVAERPCPAGDAHQGQRRGHQEVLRWAFSVQAVSLPAPACAHPCSLQQDLMTLMVRTPTPAPL
jgi:hypothetical protein